MYTIYETEVYARDRQQRLMEIAERERMMRLIRQGQAKNGRKNSLEQARKFLAKLIPSTLRNHTPRPSLEEYGQVSR